MGERLLALVCGVLTCVLAVCGPASGSAEEAEVLLRTPISPLPAPMTVQADIGGETHLLVLDTGAEHVGLDQSLRKLVGKEIGSTEITTASAQNISGTAYEAPVIHIQGISRQPAVAALVNLQPFITLCGLPLAGILGIDEFGARGKVLVDYDQCELEVHTGPWKLDAADCHEIGLVEKEGTPTLRTELGGQPVTLTLDTGSDDCINLPSALFARLAAAGVIEVASFTITGRSLSTDRPGGKYGWFLRGEFMGRSLAGVSVGTDGGEGRLGRDWLCAFNFEIDLPAHRLRYQARAHPKPPLDTEKMYAATFSYDASGARVESLWWGSQGAARAAGLQPGDVIVQVEGLKGGEINAATVAETAAARAGQTVQIRFARKSDGAQITVPLKLLETVSLWDFGGRDASAAINP